MKFPKSFISAIGAIFSMNSAMAQVVIPYGTYENGFEKYLIATIALVLLCVAVWRYYQRGR
jgi:hypothetical protein